MASQSKEEGTVLNNTLFSGLLTVLPLEIRLQIYRQVFHGSRVRLLTIPSRNPLSTELALRPSHHHQLLLVCHQIYTEALSAYWSSTIIDSALNPLFETVSFSEVLRTIPVSARPVIREIRCHGFRETDPGLNFKRFVDHLFRIETLVMEPDFLYISRSQYRQSSWSTASILTRAQRSLRRRFPGLGPDGVSGVQVLQRVQFPVIVRSMGMRIRLAARDENYPAKVRLESVSVTAY